MDALAIIADALHAAEVRFVVIGVWGVNYYARSGGMLLTTADRDLFLPLDPENLRRAWNVCEEAGHTLWCGAEPLDQPSDELVAARIVEHRAVTTALGEDGLHLDLSMVMAGFDFESVWARRRTFLVDGVEIPVARLTDIVQSKANAGREKDRLFLATHEEALRQWLDADESG